MSTEKQLLNSFSAGRPIQNTVSLGENYLQPTRYKFVLNKTPQVAYNCKSVGHPGAYLADVQQATPFNPVMLAGGQIRHDLLRVDLLIDEDLVVWETMFNWMKSCTDYIDFKEFKPQEQHMVDDGNIIVLTNANVPKLKFTYYGLFPVSISNIDFTSEDSGGRFMTASVGFMFSYYKLTRL